MHPKMSINSYKYVRTKARRCGGRVWFAMTLDFPEPENSGEHLIPVRCTCSSSCPFTIRWYADRIRIAWSHIMDNMRSLYCISVFFVCLHNQMKSKTCSKRTPYSISLNSVTGTTGIPNFLFPLRAMIRLERETTNSQKLLYLFDRKPRTFFCPHHVSNGHNRTQLPWNRMPLVVAKT